MNTESEQTLMHVVRLLVEGIGRHVVTVDPAEAARFRRSVEEVSQKLQEEISPAELLVRAGSVVQALEDHASRSTQDLQLQMAELQHMVKMLTATVSAISAAGETNVGRLGEIEKQVESASALDDVRTIKARLADCLTDIRRETQRQRKETGATIEQLTQGLSEARRTVVDTATGTVRDEVTGLGLRADAEAAMAEPARPGGQTFVAVMVLERLQAVNRKFGVEIGDQILAEFGRVVRRSLQPDDRLFRWGGPALVALVTRPATIERVRVEISGIMDAKWEHTIRTASRSILLPITSRWAVMPLMAAPRLLYHKIDVFAAAPSARDQ
ncbi:MAG TPA: diguanylate cyclase [Bryobacteraceae bacterium]|nr:diguanylate cyclase [Bryobacteraceae bacterium]